MAKINGTSLLVYINDGGGEIPIAYTTSASISIEVDLPDASNKNSQGYAESIYGQRSWSIDVEGLVDYSASYGATDFVDLITGRTQVTLRWSTNAGGSLEYEGTAHINSYTEDAPNEDVVTYSVSFTGTGAITKATV